jgi:hypothetical protein
LFLFYMLFSLNCGSFSLYNVCRPRLLALL